MVILIIWLFIILLSSVFPFAPTESGLPLDKIMHFVIYGITSTMFFKVLNHKLSANKALLLAIILSSAYGFFIEILQSYLPWRNFSLGDQVANTLGALIIGVIYKNKTHGGGKT